MITDPIADMLTMIRNATRIFRQEVTVAHSKVKEGILSKLKQEGFIRDYQVVDGSPGKSLKIHLKYGPDGEQLIREITRVSKPSRRVYNSVEKMTKVLNGLGIAILSTSKGIMTDRECRKNKIGGEVICVVW